MIPVQRVSPIQLVETFHLAFLDVLQVRVNQDDYVLKGGANLRFFYGSPRYSEDVDFDAARISRDRLEARIDDVLTSRALAFILKTRDLIVQETKKPKQTETTQRWRIILAMTGTSVKIRSTIEFSRRNPDPRHELAQIPPEIVTPYALRAPTVRHYLPAATIEQKIIALATRAETQARDVFDLDLLLRRFPNLPSKDSVDTRVVNAAVERAVELPFEAFRVQVVSFLDPGLAELYNNPNNWNQMQEHVVERLTSLR